MLTIYTFGYRNPNGRGTRSHEELATILRAAGIECEIRHLGVPGESE